MSAFSSIFERCDVENVVLMKHIAGGGRPS